MIDWAQASALKAEMGEEDFVEVVDLFLEEVEEVVTRLTQSVDLSTLEEDMHFLKGSAMSLGFSAFAAACHDGEELSAQGQADQVDVPAVLACFAASKRLFLAEAPIALAG